MVAHLDLSWVLLAHADDTPIDLQVDSLGEGHGMAAAVVVFHGDIEGDQCGLGGAEGSKLVDAGALEVKPHPVKCGVVRVTRPNAGVVLVGCTLGDAINHDTFLMGSTSPWLTSHCP